LHQTADDDFTAESGLARQDCFRSNAFLFGVRNGHGKCHPERALEKAKALFELPIVFKHPIGFKHVNRQLAIRNHPAIELLLVCAQSFSEAKTWVLGELAKLPSLEQNRVQMNNGKVFQLILNRIPTSDRVAVEFSTYLALLGLIID
jgi:hypothetical protein